MINNYAKLTLKLENAALDYARLGGFKIILET
jgi:hypothetical protein